MNVTDSSGVGIAYRVTGDGEPVTCFVPGLTQVVSDTRPFGSGVQGRKAFLDLRGQGASDAPPADQPGAWTYRALADDLRAVADEVGARQGVGVSLGAGALLSSVEQDQSRWDRLVLALPANLTDRRPSSVTDGSDALADAVDANDPIEIGRLLLQMQPEGIRGKTAVTMWVRRHAADIAGTAVSRMLRTLPHQVPVTDIARLAAFDRPVLVLAQRDDPTHPVGVAEDITRTFPNSQLVVSDEPWIWGGRARLREVMAQFLNSTGSTPPGDKDT